MTSPSRGSSRTKSASSRCSTALRCLLARWPRRLWTDMTTSKIHPWFCEIEEHPLLEVPIGHVGVVVSFVGDDSRDISGEQFTHGNIVRRGSKGVWDEPLYPGKHPL